MPDPAARPIAEILAERLRTELPTEERTEQRMFGGIGFMLNGNMVAATSKHGLLVRVGKDRHAQALVRPGARVMEMGGRLMEGFVFVDPATLDDPTLRDWLAYALVFVRTLPPKPADAKAKRTKGDRR